MIEKIFQIGPIGSRNDTAVFFLTNHGIYVRAGCFFDNLNVFSKAVKKTHGTSQHGKDYAVAIKLVKTVLVPSIKETVER